jgi:hypothetical protein
LETHGPPSRPWSGRHPPEPTVTLRPPPVADRRRAVKEFVARTHCRVKDIQEAAGVDEADYYNWLNGKTPDSYSTCREIERILRKGMPGALPRC